MELSASFYQLMLFKLIPSGPSSVWSDRVLSCQEAIEERMEGRQHILVFDRGEEGWAFILTGESEQEVERRTRDCAAGLGDLVRTYKDIQFFGGGPCLCQPLFFGNEPGGELQRDGAGIFSGRGSH